MKLKELRQVADALLESPEVPGPWAVGFFDGVLGIDWLTPIGLDRDDYLLGHADGQDAMEFVDPEAAVERAFHPEVADVA